MKRNDIVKIKDCESVDDIFLMEMQLFAEIENDFTMLQYLGCVTEIKDTLEDKDGETYFVPKGTNHMMSMDLIEGQLNTFEHKGIAIGDFARLKEDATIEDLRGPDDPSPEIEKKLNELKVFLSKNVNLISTIDVIDNAVRFHPLDIWIELDAVEIIPVSEINDKISFEGIKIGNEVKISEIADEIMIRHNSNTNERMEKYFGTTDKITGIYPLKGENLEPDYTDIMVELENAVGLYVPQALEV